MLLPVVSVAAWGNNESGDHLWRENTCQRRRTVVIVGAGVAGLTAAKRLVTGFDGMDHANKRQYHRHQYQHDQDICPPAPKVIILEASGDFGGRIQKDTTGFADYPLDLGASWVYDPMVRIPLFAQNASLYKFLEQNTIAPSRELEYYESYRIEDDEDDSDFEDYIEDCPKDEEQQYFSCNRNARHSEFEMGDEQSLWVNYSWYDFLEEHLVEPTLQRLNPHPHGNNNFVYNCPVRKVVQHSHDNQILATCGGSGGNAEVQQELQEFLADHVVVTVPLQILQDGDIQFEPPILPKQNRSIMASSKMWQGFKIFLEFSKKFYYDAWEWFPEDGELDFWDYSLVHYPHTSKHIIAGYFIGEFAEELYTLEDDEIAQRVLETLDDVFGDNQASRYFKNSMVVNWGKNQYIRGIYANQTVPWKRNMGGGPQPLWGKNNRQLLVAGEAFAVPPNHNGWVDGAALSGLHAAELILEDIISPEKMMFSIPQEIWDEEV